MPITFFRRSSSSSSTDVPATISPGRRSSGTRSSFFRWGVLKRTPSDKLSVSTPGKRLSNSASISSPGTSGCTTAHSSLNQLDSDYGSESVSAEELSRRRCIDALAATHTRAGGGGGGGGGGGDPAAHFLLVSESSSSSLLPPPPPPPLPVLLPSVTEGVQQSLPAHPPSPPPAIAEKWEVNVFASSCQNASQRKPNEDRQVSFKTVVRRGYLQGQQIECIGVIDGHGGDLSAQWLADHLAEEVASVNAWGLALPVPDLLHEVAKEALAHAEERFMELAISIDDTSGSCIVLGLFYEGHLCVANIGDCRAVLYQPMPGRAKGLFSERTQAHRCIDPVEGARVELAGGTIIRGRVFGVLQPSRTIGDLDVKRAAEGVVIPNPFLSHVKVEKMNALPGCASLDLSVRGHEQTVLDVSGQGTNKRPNNIYNKVLDLSGKRRNLATLRKQVEELQRESGISLAATAPVIAVAGVAGAGGGGMSRSRTQSLTSAEVRAILSGAPAPASQVVLSSTPPPHTPPLRPLPIPSASPRLTASLPKRSISAFSLGAPAASSSAELSTVVAAAPTASGGATRAPSPQPQPSHGIFSVGTPMSMNDGDNEDGDGGVVGCGDGGGDGDGGVIVHTLSGEMSTNSNSSQGGDDKLSVNVTARTSLTSSAGTLSSRPSTVSLDSASMATPPTSGQRKRAVEGTDGVGGGVGGEDNDDGLEKVPRAPLSPLRRSMTYLITSDDEEEEREEDRLDSFAEAGNGSGLDGPNVNPTSSTTATSTVTTSTTTTTTTTTASSSSSTSSDNSASIVASTPTTAAPATAASPSLPHMVKCISNDSIYTSGGNGDGLSNGNLSCIVAAGAAAPPKVIHGSLRGNGIDNLMASATAARSNNISNQHLRSSTVGTTYGSNGSNSSISGGNGDGLSNGNLSCIVAAGAAAPPKVIHGSLRGNGIDNLMASATAARSNNISNQHLRSSTVGTTYGSNGSNSSISSGDGGGGGGGGLRSIMKAASSRGGMSPGGGGMEDTRRGSRGSLGPLQVRQRGGKASDAFIIFATDGLWDVVPKSEVVEAAKKHIVTWDKKPKTNPAAELVKLAVREGSNDDVTVVIWVFR